MTRETTAEQRPGQLKTGRQESHQGLVDTMEAVEQGVKDGMHQVHDAVEATGRAARATVRGTGDAFTWALDVPGHVARHPWILVGAAVLVGLLVLRLRRRDWRTAPGDDCRATGREGESRGAMAKTRA